MSNWKRLGKILAPTHTPVGFSRYTQIPTPVVLENGLIRIFYATRDKNNRATSFFVDVDPNNNMSVVYQSFVPSIESSPLSEMDKDGIGITCVLAQSDGGHCYFTGLNLDNTPFFTTQIGVALNNSTDVVDDVEKQWCMPVSEEDPHMLMTPFVMKDSNCYHMWYASTQYWIEDAKPSIEYCYVVKHAVSSDGIQWKRSGKVAINFANKKEGGITRPVVIKRGEQYDMWYCYRGHYSQTDPTLRQYRIGYATSADLVHWHRRDDAHHWLNPPLPMDWDYEMQCYPYVLNYCGRQLMFYCGNQYSQAGFGVAERVL